MFHGPRVPEIQQIVNQFAELPLPEIDALLTSRTRVRNADAPTRLAELYLGAVRRGGVNNWDLVDSSAPKPVGVYL